MATMPYLVTGPTIEPVSIEDARNFLRLEIPDDDVLVAGLCKAARRYCELQTGRAFITQTWRLKLDSWYEDPWYCEDDDVILLPKPPLSSVSSITYTDTNEASQTWTSTLYTVDTDSEPGRVGPAYGEDWPTALDHYNAITITYVAGHGSGVVNVPEGIKQAIRMLVTHWYENREAVLGTGAVPQTVPLGVTALLDLHWHGQLT